jgi:hypothetical protein
MSRLCRIAHSGVIAVQRRLRSFQFTCPNYQLERATAIVMCDPGELKRKEPRTTLSASEKERTVNLPGAEFASGD